MVHLNFYLAIVLTPKYPTTGEPRCFVLIVASDWPAATAANPTSYSLHGSTWNQRRLACHVRKTAAFYKDSISQKAFGGM